MEIPPSSLWDEDEATIKTLVELLEERSKAMKRRR